MRYNTNSYVKKVKEKYGDRFTVLGEYEGGKSLIKIKCNLCNTIKTEEATKFLYRGTCQRCHHNGRIKPHEEYKNRLKSKYDNEFELLGIYIGINKKILVKHNKCGSTYQIAAYELLKHGQCRTCQPEKIHNTCINHYGKIFYEYVKNKVGEEYTVFGDYIAANEPIKVKHNKCGHVWEVKPNSFKRGGRCPICAHDAVADALRLSQLEYCDRIKNVYGDEYSVLGEYQGKSKRIKIKHNKCGHIWNPNAGNFLSGYGCPRCMESKGEKYIRKYLTERNIDFKSQYRIKECRDKLPLPFDFAIIRENKLYMLIEYDGEQHHIELPHRKLDYIQSHDKMKNDYCFKNNINLVRISYYEDEKSILDKLFGGD